MGVERFVRLVKPDVPSVPDALAFVASLHGGEFAGMKDVQFVIEQTGDAWTVIAQGNRLED